MAEGRHAVAFTGDMVRQAFERKLTATPESFERDLRQAWPDTRGSAHTRCFVIEDVACTLRIEVEPADIRRLGLLELPQLIARFQFLHGDESARRGLLHYLDRAMQKGGG